MATIVTRAGKGSPLTHNEVDANFSNLNSDKIETSAIGSTVQAHSAVLDATTASFTTADETKLDGIEAGATADQTASEIKTAYESNADTNAFTDAEQSKLSGIEAGADVTDTANVTAAGALMDSELANITAVKALDQGVATTDSPTFAGLTVDTDTLYVDSTNNRVGIGTASPSYVLDVKGTTNPSIRVASTGTASTDDAIFRAQIGGTTANSYLMFGDSADSDVGALRYDHTSDFMAFIANAAEAMRIDAAGKVLVGTTTTPANLATTSTDAGIGFDPSGYGVFVRDGGTPLYVNRLSNDGILLFFRRGGTTQGTISVSGTTVSYNGGHLSRWSRLPDGTDDSNILKGTVMTNLNEKVVWDGEDNEQLNHTTVSSTEGDKDVAGVFVAWDDSDDWGDYYLAMTGDMIIRIAAGTTVERGDLLMSAGDGTAKPQGDGIVRSKTIAKVISTETTCTYADGSYCVPCVLMAC